MARDDANSKLSAYKYVYGSTPGGSSMWYTVRIKENGWGIGPMMILAESSYLYNAYYRDIPHPLYMVYGAYKTEKQAQQEADKFNGR